MIVGIVGLGLIGGSLAKAYHAAQHRVLAYDADSSVTRFAQIAQAVDEALSRGNISTCDLILVAIYPRAAVQWMQEMADVISGVVIDCCGTKREVCAAGFRLAQEHGWLFVGGHPMAGTQFSGFKHSQADLFRGAPMVLVPPVFDDMQLIDRVRALLDPPRLREFFNYHSAAA